MERQIVQISVEARDTIIYDGLYNVHLRLDDGDMRAFALGAHNISALYGGTHLPPNAVEAALARWRNAHPDKWERHYLYGQRTIRAEPGDGIATVAAAAICNRPHGMYQTAYNSAVV